MSAKEFVVYGCKKSVFGINGSYVQKTHITDIIPPYSAKDAKRGIAIVPTDFLPPKNEN